MPKITTKTLRKSGYVCLKISKQEFDKAFKVSKCGDDLYQGQSHDLYKNQRWIGRCHAFYEAKQATAHGKNTQEYGMWLPRRVVSAFPHLQQYLSPAERRKYFAGTLFQRFCDTLFGRTRD